ncbi:hypothetical protein [Terriglobus aquaticus]|uniref:hypothetical protein n=1 Tax=Terriglobus aquaticus TaxID=940139 RepID=UPI0031E3F1BF
MSDASYVRILAGVAIGFIFLRFLPFVGLIGIFGFAFLEIAIPVLLIRWWVRYRGLQTTDPDFPRAKKTVVLTAAGVVLFFVLRITKIVVISPF